MKTSVSVFLFFYFLVSTVQAKGILETIAEFEEALIAQDSVILDKVLHRELKWEHSNGWQQNKEDVFRDFRIGRIYYQFIDNKSVLSLRDVGSEMVKVDRMVSVKGRYEIYEFEVLLKVFEVWIKEEGQYRLKERRAE